MTEETGFSEPDDIALTDALDTAGEGPVTDMGYFSLPAEVQQAAESGLHRGVTRWRKKPVEVGMVRWDGSDEAQRLIDEHGGSARSIRSVHQPQDGKLPIWVEKSQAVMWLARGDWAILEPDGTGVYPCTAEQQVATYEPASPVEPLPDAEFLTGVGSELWHAVPRTSLAFRVAGPAYSVALAACGELVRLAPKFGAYDPGTVPVKYAPCPRCRWVVAAETGGFDAALDELEHPLARDTAAMILNEAGRGLDDGEQVPEEAIDLLAAVSRHAPARLITEECAEGDCEHPDGGCPGRWACPACSLQAGQWAGEWQGKYRQECTVSAPCEVLRALAESAGALPEGS